MPWKPHVTVAAVLEREGRFLFVEEEVRGREVINQPAGHLEDGETLLEAVRRETLEETAWRMEPTALVGLYQYRGRDSETFLRVCFTGRLLERDAARELDDGILRALWLEPAEKLARTAPQPHGHALRRGLPGRQPPPPGADPAPLNVLPLPQGRGS